MADNVALPGTGKNVATEDIGGVHYQKVLPADPTTGDPVAATLDSIAAQLPDAGGFSVFISAFGAAADAKSVTDEAATAQARLRGLVSLLAEIAAAAVAASKRLGVVPVDSSGNPVEPIIDPAHDAADSGAPLKIGGKASATKPAAVDANDRANAWFDLFGIQHVQPESMGFSCFVSIDVDETADAVKAAACTLGGYHISNLHATDTRYVKLYNTNTPTVGTTAPARVIPVKAGTAANLAGMNLDFSTGLAVAATTGIANADTGAPGANEVVVNLDVK